ncbi:hypothetical protein [Flagellimonas flava]|uniref:Adhesin n=1 Tax=Flagellimonas flava TaxID=570519 RepID=A0A1M5MEW0_9FLAO|nr:hypothetical protein [Allomuricauda flava]SHG75419.1 hypothetical protein SAMN04488116_2399 [Allomuricauda flava]
MKKLGMLIATGLISLSLQGQKIIEKNIAYSNQTVDLDVKFASDIEVKTWDKSTVYFKAEIFVKEEGYQDLYRLDVRENSSTISISSDADALLKALHKLWEKEDSNGRRRHYITSDLYEFNYVLYVPKKARFTVSSINGDLRSELIQGEFTADLINGNIDIKKYNGNMDLKTINGEIDLVIRDSRLYAETIHGLIYADEDLNLKVTDRHVGQKVEGNLGNATYRLKLDTINGNMYLRL